MNHGHGTWCTKEDVLKDLEVVSGRRVTDVDDGFFVVGEQPPPPHMLSSEDDEIELRFGRAAHTQKLDQGNLEPDLNGITRMLRMVQEHENSPEEERRPEKVTPNRKVVISKLNPNVKEFIPRSTQIPCSPNTTINCDDASAKSNDVASVSDLEKTEVVAQIVSDVKSNADDINSEGVTKEIKKQIAMKLKNKISAKNDTFEDVRQSNIAIVNLLKLYAKNRTEPKVTEPAAKPLNLLTPQFFQTRKASDFKSNFANTSDGFSERSASLSLPSIDKVDNNENSLDQPPDFIADKKKDIDEAVAKPNYSIKKDEIATYKKNNNKIDFTVLNKENSKTKPLDEATSLTPDMADTTIMCENNIIPSIVVEEPQDPVIAESINKVNDWLDDKPHVNVSKKENPKGPVLHFGTVAYKRKDPVTCKSPSEVVDKKISKSSEGSYKPSSYAEELLKKYKERSKKPTTTLNIWEKLENDLKEKDKEIKNRKK